MRLKLFCNHDYYAAETERGENLLGMVTYAVTFRCRKCLKIKREIGYSSRASAEAALAEYQDQMGGRRAAGG